MAYTLESANATRVRTIRLDDGRWAKLAAAALRTGRSASEVLRDLIDLFADGDAQTAIETLTLQRDAALRRAETAEAALAQIRSAVA